MVSIPALGEPSSDDLEAANEAAPAVIIPAPASAVRLKKLTPRKYSISSSQLVARNSVHITVAVVTSKVNGQIRHGGASGYLASRVVEGDEIQIFFEKSDHFHLPEDSNSDIIMIGSGTGLAPFRAFLQHRKELGHTGKSWLCFGNRQLQHDYLYQAELETFREQGVISDLSLAFSRDQEHKVYVQHRIQENGRQLFDWMENGAYIYVCGDATKMAKNVETAIVQVIETHGNESNSDAVNYLKKMKNDNRFLLDVY